MASNVGWFTNRQTRMKLCYNKIMNKKLIQYIFESFFVIIALPYLVIAFATSLTGLGIAIMLFMAVLPIYFILSPLRFDTKIIWLIPIFNTVLFLLSVRITFNNSADDYLLAYIPIAYLAISIKYLYKHNRCKKHFL